MGKELSLYEPHLNNEMIRVTRIGFDFEKNIYPSWYSVIRGKRMCCHYHLHQVMEMIVMREGHIKFQVDGTEYDLYEDDVLIINPFEPHSATIPQDCDRTLYYAMNIDMSSLSVIPSGKLKKITNALVNGNSVYPNIPETDEKKRRVLKSAVEITDDADCDELVRLSALLRIFAILGEPETLNKERDNKRSDQFIRTTVAYIQNTPLQELSLEAVAESLSYNKAYFTTLFRKNFGMTFTDYINNYKISIAKRQIRNGNYNLNDVAEKSGYNYYAYFFKKFKATVGISPSDFVDQCRANAQKK